MPEDRLYPVEQTALTLLRQTNYPWQPGVSPLVQLMQWGLLEGVSDQWPHLIGPQSQMLQTMAGWEPWEVLQFLLRNPQDEEHEDHADLLGPEDLEELSPQEAAQVLLNLLHSQMQTWDQDYPPASNLQSAQPLATA
jgi:hypothetical protein